MRRYAGLIAGFLLLLGGCRQYVKVPMEYRRAPLIEGLADKTLLMGTVANHCELFDASSDVDNMVEDIVRKEKIFKIIQRLPASDCPGVSLEDVRKAVSSFEWSKWCASHPGDYLLLSEIWFHSENHSGYESIWRVNRAGYRYPVKVWRDKMAYIMKLRFVLIDVVHGEVVADKTYRDEKLVEGAADEVGAFLSMAEEKTRSFFDYLQGKKIETYRFLLYR